MVFWNFLNGVPWRIVRSISSRMVLSTSMPVALATVEESLCCRQTPIRPGVIELAKPRMVERSVIMRRFYAFSTSLLRLSLF